MLGELGGDMEDDYSLPQDVEEVYIPSTKDEELGGLFASTLQIADRDVNSYIQTSPGGLLRPQDLMGGAAAPPGAPQSPFQAQQQAFEDLENALNGDLSHLTQVEEPSPVKRRPATPPPREESKDPEPTPEPEPEEQ